MTSKKPTITLSKRKQAYIRYRKSKLYTIINKVNWSYRWNQLKDRMFYIIGFITIISLSKIPDWPIVGQIYIELQMMGAIPNDTGVAATFTFIAIFTIFVVSWDLLGGYSGQISFGHALYFGLGAYMTLLFKVGFKTELPGVKFEKSRIVFHMFPYVHSGYANDMRNINGTQVNFGFIEALVVAAFWVTLFSIFMAVLTLRSKGAYFALITLVLPLIFAELVRLKYFEDLTGGDGGRSFPDTQRIVPIDPDNGIDFFRMLEVEYPVILAISIISIAIMYIIAKSRIGIIFQAIREDELATSASGINVNFYKTLSFAISSFFAAIAGGLILHTFKSATSSIFGVEQSFQPIIFTIIGGIGSITGAVVGTIFLLLAINWYINDAFIDNPTIDGMALALLLILILRFQPLGLIRAQQRFRNAIIIAAIWTLSLLFYDAADGWIIGQTTTGLKRVDVDNKSILARFFGNIQFVKSPEEFLMDNFSDGIFDINVLVVEGRLLLYFMSGLILGYFGPDLLKKIRLKFWGVWPSLGKYDPPT